MDAPTWTVALMVCVATLLVGWDIYVAFFNVIPNEQDTESGLLRRAGQAFVGIPFAWGVLGGHFWGPHHELFPKWSPLILIPIMLILSVIHFIIRRFCKIRAWFVLMYLMLGLAGGVLFWSQ